MLVIYVPDRGYTMEEVLIPLHLDAKHTCGRTNPRPALDYELY